MDLFTRLNLFASLPEGQKRALFYTAIYNDLRVLDVVNPHFRVQDLS